LKGGNRRLLIECIKARVRKKVCKRWMGEKEDFTDKMDLVRREVKYLGRDKGYN